MRRVFGGQRAVGSQKGSTWVRTPGTGDRPLKISHIRTIPLIGKTPDGGWAQGFDPNENLHTLVEVHTDEGLVGRGSCYTSQALVEASLSLVRPYLAGENALEPECVSEKLLQSTFWQGRGGAVAHAVSGIDIALWDILGQATGQPIGRLLGGCYRDRIKPYGSLLFAEPEMLRRSLEAAMERGFRALKIGWGDFGRVDRKLDERLVKTARDAVGPDVEIMVDAGGSEQFWPHGYKWGIETARMLADYAITWFEEALPPDDIEGYKRLREHAPLPISTGEVLTRRQSFMPWIEQGAVDIIQPDSTKCGGLSEARRIAWMAYDHNIQLVSHGWNTAVGLAADLHLAAAMPVARYVEYITPAPYIDEIVAEPFVLDADGMLAIPTGPGLGITLDTDAIEAMSKRH
ncbi:MAG TPA: mandelate racemase/muconate lactonizing enzyme family protein [Chthonomonadaceae bacterium]|nr:mandelate racemase/muconate lactonizing enzyme family protein [Chthonomonadaceae bacterium]